MPPERSGVFYASGPLKVLTNPILTVSPARAAFDRESIKAPASLNAAFMNPSDVNQFVPRA
jgi:hypothetical protein